MGGPNSGRRGRPLTIDDCLKIEIALLLRNGFITEGVETAGILRWNDAREQASSIQFAVNMADAARPVLVLSYDWSLTGQAPRAVRQTIQLLTTRPHYGGKRWWFSCPETGCRVSKLYKAPESEHFASRSRLSLGYRSQRVPSHLRSAEQLLKLQEQFGYLPDCVAPLIRPKRMWIRTHRKHLSRLAPLRAEYQRELTRWECYKLLR